jgi:hypothetical protein
MNLSIITAVIPSLHRVLHDLKHGALGTRITEGQYELSLGGSRASSNGLSAKFGLSKSSSSGVSRSDPKSSTSHSGNSHSQTHPHHQYQHHHQHHHSAFRLSNRIFSDQAASPANLGRLPNDHSGKGRNDRAAILEEDSTTSLTRNNGVLQTWEISVEVEEEKGRK